MKKIGLLMMIIVSLLVSGCSKNAEQVKNPTFGEKNNAKIKISDISLNGYDMEKLSFPTAENFRLQSVRWIDDKSMLIILDDRSPTHQDNLTSRIYYITIQEDKEPRLIFDGSFIGMDQIIWLKKLTTGDLLLEGLDRALRIDLKTFTVTETIKYPKGSNRADITFDGKKIAYDNEQGLFVDTIPYSTPVQIFESNYNEKEKQVPGEPKWSKDGKVLCYTTNGKNPFKYVFVTTEGKKIWEYPVEANGFGWWFEDNQNFASVSLGENFGKIPKLYIININNKTVYESPESGALLIDTPPFRDRLLYIQSLTDKFSERHYFPQKLKQLNITTKEEKVVTPEFQNITSPTISSTGKIAFIGLYSKSESENVYNIYILNDSI